jgi:hypothetical protein
MLFSQRLVESPFYQEIFHEFFNGAYTAAGSRKLGPQVS